jgi:hypothetical protein
MSLWTCRIDGSLRLAVCIWLPAVADGRRKVLPVLRLLRDLGLGSVSHVGDDSLLCATLGSGVEDGVNDGRDGNARPLARSIVPYKVR